MVTRVIKETADIERLARFLSARKLPLTVTIAQGLDRTGQQNRLAHRWFSDIARQLGDQTREEVRAECKLTIGVPILRAENEAFRMVYDKRMKSLPYEDKLEEILVFDLPVTRLMTVKQMGAFMDEMQRHWLGLGMRLTDPEALKYEQEFAA